MTTPPADWYDDPDNPANYRYWDGSQWTEHRSPKRTPGSGDNAGSAWSALPAESALSVFGRMFRLFGSCWRQAAIVSIPALVGQILGVYLTFFALNELFKGRVREIFDRITAEGFDPTGRDEVWLNSLDMQFTSTFGLNSAAALIVFVIPFLITTVGLTRLFMAAANGGQPTASEALRGALGQLPRALSNYLLLCVVVVLVLGISIALASLEPRLLIVIIPAVLLLWIYLLPHYIIFTVSVAAGLPDRSPFGVAIDTTENRWGYLFSRALVLILTYLVIGFFTGMFSQPSLYLGLLAYLLFSAVTQMVQTALARAGHVVIWQDSGASTDPALLPAASSDSVV